jgi:hypothetical protein
MAFTDFALEMVLERFSLEPARVALSANVVASQPSAWLLETLECYKPLAFTSKKSRLGVFDCPNFIRGSSFS